MRKLLMAVIAITIVWGLWHRARPPRDVHFAFGADDMRSAVAGRWTIALARAPGAPASVLEVDIDAIDLVERHPDVEVSALPLRVRPVRSERAIEATLFVRGTHFERGVMMVLLDGKLAAAVHVSVTGAVLEVHPYAAVTGLWRDARHLGTAR